MKRKVAQSYRYLLFYLFHFAINRFPSKDGGLRDAWTKAVSRQDANSSTLWQPGTGSALCCDHFLLTDFQVRPGAAKRLLKDTAVPSVFPSYPKYMQVKT